MVGRPRDGDDRVNWLIEHARFEQALHILDTDRSLKSSSHQKVSPAISGPAGCRKLTAHPQRACDSSAVLPRDQA